MNTAIINLAMLGWLGYLLFIAKDPANEAEEWALSISIYITYILLIITNILVII